MDDQEKQPYNITLTFKDGVATSYEDIIGYQVSGTVIAVMTKDGETHVYPMTDITFVRHFPQVA